MVLRSTTFTVSSFLLLFCFYAKLEVEFRVSVKVREISEEELKSLEISTQVFTIDEHII